MEVRSTYRCQVSTRPQSSSRSLRYPQRLRMSDCLNSLSLDRSSELPFLCSPFRVHPNELLLFFSPLSNSTTTNSTSTSNSTIAAGSSNLPVPTGPNLALNATIYASTSSYNQGADKAIDGSVNGYKDDGSGDYSKEWASNHEGAGAGLYLTWPTSINVSTVVLYDRPNAGDQVTAGRLTFSDGSTFQVSTLPNNGSAFVVPIGNRATTSLAFSVTGVSDSTSNVGLAEIQVYGSLAS